MDYYFRNNYYKYIFENSLDAIMLTSLEGEIYVANKAACDMFQRTETELIILGRECIVDKDDPRLEPALTERAEKGQVKAELTFKRKDGTKFPVYITSSVFKDNKGKAWTVLIVRDISLVKKYEEELKRLNEENANLAMYDYLTGVFNRRGFIKELKAEMERAKRESLPMSIIMMDVDLLKQINDKYGHVCGDKVLIQFAQKLENSLRLYDMLGRYGGDEFIICLPNTNYEEAIIIAERLRRQIEDMKIEYNSTIINITTSFGVVFYDYKSNEEIETIINRADYYLYQAKNLRNTVCFIK